MTSRKKPEEESPSKDAETAAEKVKKPKARKKETEANKPEAPVEPAKIIEAPAEIAKIPEASVEPAKDSQTSTETVPAIEAQAESPASAEEPSARGRRSDEGFSVEDAPAIWTPKTELGRRVHAGEITSMKDITKSGQMIKEVGIVDKLLPGLKDEIIDVGRVQRVTDSGRRMRFRVSVAVGNENGYIGIGEGKAKEVGPAIRKAIDRAKMSIREIKRGCGSWECGCGTPHTVPFKTSGKAGSVTVTISPAPKGVGLKSGEITKTILSLAGIKDAWVKTSGHTRTGVNFAHAVYGALVNTNYVKMGDGTMEKFRIISGSKEA